MKCDEARVALSARLDGEETGVAEEPLATHLAGCAACRTWRLRAERTTRVARLQRVEVPDLTAAVLAAVNRDRRHTRRAWPVFVLRTTVAVGAVAQLLLAVPELVADPGGAHAHRELASFDVAIAVGFLLVAWRPVLARTYAPVVVVLAGCLALTGGVDVMAATTGPVHELTHLITVVQAVLLWLLSRAGRGGPGRTGVDQGAYAAPGAA